MQTQPRTLKRVEQIGAEKVIESVRKDVEFMSGGKTFTEEHWEVLYNALLYYEREIRSK